MDKEKELAALKNRRARLWDFFANPRAIVCDGKTLTFEFVERRDTSD